MKTFFKWAGIFLLAIVLVGSAFGYMFRKELIEKYKPTVDQYGDINIVIKDDTSYISSRLIVTNNSFLRIDFDTVKYKIFLFHKKYLENIKALNLDLKGYDTDTIDFSVKVPYVSIIRELKEQRKNRDSASYTLNIFLSYSTFLGKKEMPINKSAKIKIPQPPELDLVAVKYSKMRKKKILANAEIKIVNYSPVTVTINDLNYSMQIMQQGNLKGKYGSPVELKPNEATFINLPIEISIDNIGKTLFQIALNKDNYDYTIKMTAEVTSIDPIRKSFQIDLTKTGRMELLKTKH
jgi:LEA14-like dessication related protein